jgi:glycosyltransferase involved in cell wall biosynthesis
MIFPSRLETWGLPISEFSPYKKPMLVADLEYAHETVGEDVAVSYFNPGRAQELAKRMKSLINDDYSFLVRNKKPYIQNPFVSSWKELFNIILE